MLPFSPSAERNAGPILEVLKAHFADRRRVLEIGSGTGQHALRFAAELPGLSWQCSEVAGHLPELRARLDTAEPPGLPAPIALDVAGPWPVGEWDAIYTANTLHIMGWPQVLALFGALPAVASADAVLVVYGPFNYAGRFTGPGNAAFDASLRAADPVRGIRDAEAVQALARSAGFVPIEDRAMPADNRCLVWRRTRRG